MSFDPSRISGTRTITAVFERKRGLALFKLNGQFTLHDKLNVAPTVVRVNTSHDNTSGFIGTRVLFRYTTSTESSDPLIVHLKSQDGVKLKSVPRVNPESESYLGLFFRTIVVDLSIPSSLKHGRFELGLQREADENWIGVVDVPFVNERVDRLSFPTRVGFGIQAVGISKIKEVLIEARDGSQFSIDNVKVTSSSFEVSTPTGTNSKHSLTIKFTPNAIGSYNANLTMHTSQEVESSIQIELNGYSKN